VSNVVYLNNVTKLDLPPDRVLEQAIGKLEDVVIVGYTKEGDEYFASSYASGPEALWLLERCKQELLAVPETYEP
jgi:hypothetical protein